MIRMSCFEASGVPARKTYFVKKVFTRFWQRQEFSSCVEFSDVTKFRSKLRLKLSIGFNCFQNSYTYLGEKKTQENLAY